jgi:anti-sigma factor RsiW
VSKRRSDHLSEEQLAQFQDGRLPAREVSHLEACSECSARLSDLEAADAAYREYLASAPALPPQT